MKCVDVALNSTEILTSTKTAKTVHLVLLIEVTSTVIKMFLKMWVLIFRVSPKSQIASLPQRATIYTANSTLYPETLSSESG